MEKLALRLSPVSQVVKALSMPELPFHPLEVSEERFGSPVCQVESELVEDGACCLSPLMYRCTAQLSAQTGPNATKPEESDDLLSQLLESPVGPDKPSVPEAPRQYLYNL